MDFKLALFLLVLGTRYIPSNARSFGALDIISKNDKFCTLCEEYASEAIDFLGKNKTQGEILSTLHQVCSKLAPLKKKCTTLVDQYVPSFFTEVSTIQPEKFCRKVNLCKDATLLHVSKDDEACTLCHNVVAEILEKLKDPDTQLEVIQILLKGCNKMENYAKQCKKLVFQYAPVILINAEKIFEKSDICTTIHACKASQAVSELELDSA